MVAAFVVGGAATPAHAIVVPWSGAGSSGIDGAPTTNLGDSWQLTNGNMTWAITPSPSAFNSALFNNSFGTFATAFQFTINSGVAGIGSAQLVDLTTSQNWNSAISLAAQRVTLNAPAGTQLNAGDQYALDINFGGAADPGTFSFAALWSDSPISNTSVSEPTTLSLFGIAALALVVMRRQLFAAI
ncbi:MAG: PEP-CTERM sorting domain-containing protein [Stellaceae bacterium]